MSPSIMRVNPALAAAIGLNESIVLLQLDYLIGISTSEHHDGKQWTYQQWKGGFDQMFPWMVEKTLRRCIATLKDRGLVETSRHRTNWYTVNRDKLAEFTRQNVLSNEDDKGQIVPLSEDKMSSGADEKGQNVSLEKDKMSSDKGTKCPFPIHTEISTKISTKTKTVVDAPAVAPPAPKAKAKAAKPDKTEARKTLNRHISAVHKLFAELFAPAAERDAPFMGRNIQDALQCYPLDDVTGTLQAIAARNPNAKATNRTISLIDLGVWVEEWLSAGRPAVFPTTVNFRLSGGSHGPVVSRPVAASQSLAGDDRRATVRAAKFRREEGGVAARAG